jgi:hypothetical protein
MAIEIVSFPIKKHGGSFHSYVNVYSGNWSPRENKIDGFFSASNS